MTGIFSLSHRSWPFAIQRLTAGVAELVDAPDLGSGAFGVGVRVPSPAPKLSLKRKVEGLQIK